MTVFEFLTADQNGPFMIAVAIVGILGVLECVSLMFGMALSGLIDDILPDFGADADADFALDGDMDADLDADADMDADADGSVSMDGDVSIFGQAFSWLNGGRVPLMILLIIFLTGFAVVGYMAQWFIKGLALMPWQMAMIPAFIGAIPVTRYASMGFSKILPKDETYAVNEETMIGLVGEVTLGPVSRRNPGKARFVGPHGNTHFLRVRSARNREKFPVGSQVLVTSNKRALYDVIAAPDHLTND